MTDAEQKICGDIHRFLISEMVDKLDGVSFAQTTLVDFGRHVFEIVKQNVAGSTDDHIKAVIRASGHGDTTGPEDYYLGLCHSVLRLKEVPGKSYNNYLRRYVSVFIREYQKIVANANSRINTLDADLDAGKASMEAIIAASDSNHHITKDIRESEQRLSALYQKCNDHRTQKEMLQYVLAYLNECMARFCDIKSRASVLKTLRKKAFTTSREGHFTIDDEFEYYEEILRINKANIEDIFRIVQVVKLQPFYDEIRKRAHGTGHLGEEMEEKALQALREEFDALPQITVLKEAKSKDIPAYRALLDTLIRRYDVPGLAAEKINKSVSIGERRSILLKAINLFNNGEYDVFNNIIPIQLEGLFADCLKDGTVFSRFTNLNIYPQALLKEKIMYIKDLGVDVYPEAVMYFGFYFNNLVRNKVADGNYTYGNDGLAAIFAMEMLLDLNCLMHMLLRRSETEKMYRLIHTYKEYMRNFKTPNHHFEFLFNDLTKNRTHLEYDSVERLRPMQFAYWLMNPYYEEIYARVGNVETLKELRADFTSKAFWLFVLEKLNSIIEVGYDYLYINREFFSVVKGLFRCGLSDDTRSTLAKVNAVLSQIEKLR